MTKTTFEFVTIAEARAHFLRQGYCTVDLTYNSAIMEKYVNGSSASVVVINRKGFMQVSAELITVA